MKKNIKRIVLSLLFAGVIYGLVYAWKALPIISGYGAKDLCSCVFLSRRDPRSVIKKELGNMPLSLGRFSINMEDSSATGNVLGLAERKAIFRKGLGCTLINGISEKELREQKFELASPLAISQDTVAWPMGNKSTAIKTTGINFEQLNKAVEYAFERPGDVSKRQTRGIIVLYDGQIAAEKYADGFGINSVHIGWSMAKSVNSALIGILVKQGKLDIHSATGIEAWKNDGRKKITLDQLLHANSGLNWSEKYNGPSDVTNMLYKKKDMATFAVTAKLKYEPGTYFNYSSGTSNILSYLVRKTVGDKDYYHFPYTALFQKIGMNSAIFEPDASGTFTASSYCFATLRDFTRFGLLYLNDGYFNGEQILPEGWVKYSMTPAKGASMGEYGAQFWLNAGAPGNPENRKYPDVPPDCFYADGYEGQYIWIIPSKKLVVARIALEQGNNLDENKFLSEIIKAFTVK